MPAPSSHAFSEKVALISEGTTPIGRAVALQLALYGAYVIVAHPESDGAKSDIDELKSLGTLAASVAYSGYGQNDALELVSFVEKLYGRLDFLVNCPQIEGNIELHELSDGHLSAVLEKGLKSTFFNTKECIRLMADRPKPIIVNVFSAVDGESTIDPIARAVNSAIGEFTVAISEQLGTQFRVNGISVSQTSNREERAAELDPELFRPKTAVDPDDVARAVLFLLSSESSGVRGQILSIGQ